MEKVNFAGFLKVPTFIGYEDEDGKRKHNKETACLNPLSISAYWPSSLKDDDGVIHDVTKVDCGHYSWVVNIPYKEFDKFFDTIHRGFEYGED